MDNKNTLELISAYLAHSKIVSKAKEDKENTWARDKVHKIVLNNPQKGLFLTTELIKKRRAELNLPDFQMDCLDDVEKLLKH